MIQQTTAMHMGLSLEYLHCKDNCLVKMASAFIDTLDKIYAQTNQTSTKKSFSNNNVGDK